MSGSGPGGLRTEQPTGATVSRPFTASRATLALKARLCFLRPFTISHSLPTAIAVLSLGAGLSLAYLSEIPVQPQVGLIITYSSATSKAQAPQKLNPIENETRTYLLRAFHMLLSHNVLDRNTLSDSPSRVIKA